MHINKENQRLIVFSCLFAQTIYLKYVSTLRVGVCTVHHQRDINTDQEALDLEIPCLQLQLVCAPASHKLQFFKNILGCRLCSHSQLRSLKCYSLCFTNLLILQKTTRGLGNFLLESTINRIGRPVRNKWEFQVKKTSCFYFIIPLMLRSSTCPKILLYTRFLGGEPGLRINIHHGHYLCLAANAIC